MGLLRISSVIGHLTRSKRVSFVFINTSAWLFLLFVSDSWNRVGFLENLLTPKKPTSFSQDNLKDTRVWAGERLT